MAMEGGKYFEKRKVLRREWLEETGQWRLSSGLKRPDCDDIAQMT